MAKTQRIRMPLLSAGQAQKELTHNEGLILLDALVHGCCEGSPTPGPPQNPEPGLCYICGLTPTGAWSGHANAVAWWSANGWRFAQPFDGLELVDRASGLNWRFMSGRWSSGVVEALEVQVNGSKVLGVQQPAVVDASGGATVDVEARKVLAQVLLALRSHGLIASAG